MKFDAEHEHKYIHEIVYNNELKNYVVNKNQPDTWLTPAYFLTVYKAQGSEYNNVVLVVAQYFCTRRWFYTGVTRAKQRVCIFSENMCYKGACKKNDTCGSLTPS